jgi:transposase
MHGPQHSTNFTRILAVDLGKFNSVACVYERHTHAHRFVSVATTPQTIHDLLVEHQSSDPSDTLLVIETCDVAGWVYDIATALGMPIAIANPSHEAWRWTRVKRKTDKDDALKLAKLTLLGQLPTVHMPPPAQRQRRRLVHYRRVLVERRTAIKNQVRSIYSQQGLSLPMRGKAWTKAGVKQMSEDARAIESSAVDDLWRGRLHVELQLLDAISRQIDQVDAKLDALGAEDQRIKLLQTVPGVGPRLAETVVAHLDDPHRFKSAGQVASYAGLVPKLMESGTMKRSGRITRRGPTLLRSMLVEVAWMVYLRNAWAKSFVERISRGIKSRRKIAIVALARKLLVMLWAMLRDGTSWRDPCAEKDQGEVVRCAAGGGGCSPPEDTGPVTAVSSVVVAIG